MDDPQHFRDRQTDHGSVGGEWWRTAKLVSSRFGPAMLSAIGKDLFVFQPPGRRSSYQIILYLILCIVSVFVVGESRPSPDDTLPPSAFHAREAMEYALSEKICGTFRLDVFNNQHITEYIKKNPSLAHQPLLQVAVRQFEDKRAYCKAHRFFRSFKDVGLLSLINIAIFVKEDISLSELGSVLYWSKVTILIIAAGLVIHMGSPVLLSASLFWIFLKILDWYHGRYFFDLYGFIPVFLLIFVTSFAAMTETAKGWLWAFIVFGLGGVLLCIGTNFRATMFVIGFPVILTTLALAFFRMPAVGSSAKAPGRVIWVSMALVVGTFAFLATNEIAFNQYKLGKDKGVSSYPSYHAISHQIVMGLGVGTGDSALVERENLGASFGNDAVVFKKSKTIDPDVKWHTRDYEKLLWAYYTGLWIRYPGELLGLYIEKLDYSARRIVDQFCRKGIAGDSPISLVCDLEDYVFSGSGQKMLLGFGLIGIISVYFYFVTGSVLWLGFILSTVVSILLFFETVLTFGVFKAQSFIQAYWVMVFLATPFITTQGLIRVLMKRNKWMRNLMQQQSAKIGAGGLLLAGGLLVYTPSLWASISPALPIKTTKCPISLWVDGQAADPTDDGFGYWDLMISGPQSQLPVIDILKSGVRPSTSGVGSCELKITGLPAQVAKDAPVDWRIGYKVLNPRAFAGKSVYVSMQIKSDRPLSFSRLEAYSYDGVNVVSQFVRRLNDEWQEVGWVHDVPKKTKELQIWLRLALHNSTISRPGSVILSDVRLESN
jgi:hypothetical protein